MRKYAFETIFSPEGEILRDAQGARRVFTAEEVEAERAAAYEAGRNDQLAAAQLQIAAELARANAALARIVGSYQAEMRRTRDGAAELAIAAARAAAGSAVEAFGDARIRTVLEGVLAEALPAPRLVVRISPEAADRLRPEAERLADDHGFTGAIQVRADASIGQGDVKIDWGEGLIALDLTQALDEIASRVRARLAGTAAPEISP